MLNVFLLHEISMNEFGIAHKMLTNTLNKSIYCKKTHLKSVYNCDVW